MTCGYMNHDQRIYASLLDTTAILYRRDVSFICVYFKSIIPMYIICSLTAVYENESIVIYCIPVVPQDSCANDEDATRCLGMKEVLDL
jgi:hypothetical protein